MPRIRTVKPAFWAHPAMGRASDGAKCLALALLNFADDEGFFQADPALVRNFARPFDATPARTADLMGEVWRTEWIEIRQHPTYGALGWVVKFRDHQVVSKPQKSSLKTYFDKAEKQSPPPPPESHHSGPSPDPFHADSGTDSSTTPSGKGREGKGMEEEAARAQPFPVADPSDKPAAGQGSTPEPDSPLAIYLRRAWPELEDPVTFARVCSEAYPALDLVVVAKNARAAFVADNPTRKPPVKYLRDWFGREKAGAPLGRGSFPGSAGHETGRRTPSSADTRKLLRAEEENAKRVEQQRATRGGKSPLAAIRAKAGKPE